MTTPKAEVTVRTKDGSTVTVTRADVATAALDAPEYTAFGRNDFWVVVHIGGRLIPALPLMRAIVDDYTGNTNDAEKKLHELGFRIFVTRLFDSAGNPVRLRQDQTNGATP